MQDSAVQPTLHSTAEEALREISLKGRRAVVTGATSSIGIETTRVLALAGADVVLAVRNVQRGEQLAAELRARLPMAAGSLAVAKLELADLRSVVGFARAFAGRAIDLLINNARVMATPLGLTAQGVEQQLGINHLGHCALTRALLPSLAAARAPRVVTVSSALHDRGEPERLFSTLERDPGYQQRTYQRVEAYGDSKLANVLFAGALARRLPRGALSLAVHPGVIAAHHQHGAGELAAAYRALGHLFLKTVQQGAATSIYAATAPELHGQSGGYLADCALAKTSEAASDPELGERLWAISERLVASLTS
jgi:NAD(P)-dependent dehydrogenase (short-subunit alcohol dehydrogenase family)